MDTIQSITKQSNEPRRVWHGSAGVHFEFPASCRPLPSQPEPMTLSVPIRKCPRFSEGLNIFT
ncbi:hypothetical protein BVRB_7g172750 [Beta vulgaris subsp. vulgaris]|nr:hypothetical protein BVRB_7g172750 [Beta vulgaris subsp. vulgaris]